jgi:hypothetical protein
MRGAVKLYFVLHTDQVLLKDSYELIFMMQTWTIFSIIQVRIALFLFGNIHEA